MRTCLRYILFTAVSVLILAAVGFSAVPYMNDAKGFGLNVPEKWEVQEAEGGKLVTVTAPAAEGSKQTYRPNVRFILETPVENKELIDYARGVLTDLKRRYPDFTSRHNGRQVISHKSARWWIASWHENQTAWKGMIYVVLTDDRAFTIIAASPAEQYGKYKDILGDIASSLKFY